VLKFTTLFLTHTFGVPKKRIGVYNGIAVRDVPILEEDDEFDHEEQLIESIRNFISSGEKVILIGAGTGASTASASRQVGSNGSVHAFEASDRAVSKCKDTVRLNQVDDIADCTHAIIEAPIHVVGHSNDAKQLSATDLPTCDTLVMDCEGAEREILRNIEKYPEKIIVETHSHFDSSSNMIREILSNEYTEINTLKRSDNIDVLTFVKK